MARILIIEDEAPIRVNLLRFLRLEGHEVFEAENGSVGLALLLQIRPDLVFCDLMMPVMDGMGVLDGLRSEPSLRHTPFIFLTASAASEQVQLGVAHGANAYVTKPFNLGDLRGLIAQHLMSGVSV